ncbi:ABC transporter ATP-binding protein [Priestia megaterium]|uniref:ABC transporter ATP-binding protein n=1 Tax=Priestia megaterium TaxID=1404 RepID=UPI0013E3FA58|nr:ABC transporter ATP-binding protein [Priestia megaterium]MED3867244.1 ABC transporter ATP-binding protein [Priestia megaterium]MED4145630.1 ABC transporter ATP-binding protein [Priestia megaterium]MED4170311.1 ABC transporter ATP-binding protein [Priestia megaterium]
MKTILSVENITKIYGEDFNQFYALRDVSVTVKEGEFLAIMGTSGSGKSTLLNMMSGLDKPTKGEVILDGQKINQLKDSALTTIRRDNIGFIFQFFNLIPVLTAIENVTLPIDLAGKRKAETKGKETLKLLGISQLKDSYPSQMSGGQQQRVAIARALVTEPKIILADEPTGSLDSKTGKEILNILRHFCDNLNHSLVMVTHDANVASYAHRVIFLQDGVIQDELLLKNKNLSAKEKVTKITERVEGISL